MTVGEAELVRKAKAGDRAAFGELYTLYRQRAYGICFRIARNPTEAEDLVQEVFLKLHYQIKTFRGESTFNTWFFRFVFNFGISRLRTKNRRKSVSLEKLIPQISTADSRLEFSVERIMFYEALARLAPSYREIFYLRDIAGYEHREIAKILGISVTASKTRIGRARTKLLHSFKSLSFFPRRKRKYP
jgi:RNA polymerase sigma-70 factor, ECF subfamily